MLLKTALFGAKLYFLAAMSNKPSQIHRQGYNYDFDIMTKNDLDLKDSIIIAANAFCISIVYHHEGKCFKVKPDYTLFPEPPKIHLLISESKSCILLNKKREEKSYYNELKSLGEEIKKKEENLNELERKKSEKQEEEFKSKAELKSLKKQDREAKETKKEKSKLEEGISDLLNKVNKILEDRFASK